MISFLFYLIFIQIFSSQFWPIICQYCIYMEGEFGTECSKILAKYKFDAETELYKQNLTAYLQHNEDIIFYMYKNGRRMIVVPVEELVKIDEIVNRENDQIQRHFDEILDGLTNLMTAFIYRIMEEQMEYGKELNSELKKLMLIKNETKRNETIWNKIEKFRSECRNQLLTLKTEMEMLVSEHNLAQRAHALVLRDAVNELAEKHGSRPIDPIHEEQMANSHKLGLLLMAAENPEINYKMHVEMNFMNIVHKKAKILDQHPLDERKKDNNKMAQNRAKLSP